MLSTLYKTSQSWKDFPIKLNDLVVKLRPEATIVEIGAGANPALLKEQIVGRKYILIDTSTIELDKADGDYFDRKCIDITKSKVEIKADLIITKMLLEHIPNPFEFHKACHSLLKSDGKAIHFYATLYSPASIVNLILPESVSKPLLYKIQNRKWETEGKFPAYYRWTLGPTTKQIKRFESSGFKIESFNGYLGQGYFFGKPILGALEKVWNRVLWKVNSPYLCSNAIVLMKKDNEKPKSNF